MVMAKEEDKEVVEVKVASNDDFLNVRPKVMKGCGQLVLGELF